MYFFVHLYMRVCNQVILSYFYTKTYVVGSQKNHLNELFFLRTQNIYMLKWMGLDAKNLSLGVCEQQGADQPAHLRSLISPFVIHFLERTKSKLVKSKIPAFLLVSVAE